MSQPRRPSQDIIDSAADLMSDEPLELASRTEERALWKSVDRYVAQVDGEKVLKLANPAIREFFAENPNVIIRHLIDSFFSSFKIIMRDAPSTPPGSLIPEEMLWVTSDQKAARRHLKYFADAHKETRGKSLFIRKGSLRNARSIAEKYFPVPKKVDEITFAEAWMVSSKAEIHNSAELLRVIEIGERSMRLYAGRIKDPKIKEALLKEVDDIVNFFRLRLSSHIS